MIFVLASGEKISAEMATPEQIANSIALVFKNPPKKATE